MIRDERMIRQKHLAAVLGVSLDTIKRWKREEKLPPAVQIGPRSVAWREKDIEAYIARNSPTGNKWVELAATAKEINEKEETVPEIAVPRRRGRPPKSAAPTQVKPIERTCSKEMWIDFVKLTLPVVLAHYLKTEESSIQAEKFALEDAFDIASEMALRYDETPWEQ